MKRWLCVLTALLVPIAGFAWAEEPYRTWTDTQGRTLRGRYVGVEASKVQLMTQSGLKSILIEKLSSADVGYISRAQRGLPQPEEKEETAEQAPPKKKSKKESGTASADKFYYEDFTTVEPGQLPDNWDGGETMLVKKQGRGTAISRPAEQSQHRRTFRIQAKRSTGSGL